MKLVFAPGCFDSFEGTQEELDQLIKDIEQGFGDGSLFEKSKQLDLDDFDELTEEEYEALIEAMENLPRNNKTLN